MSASYVIQNSIERNLFGCPNQNIKVNYIVKLVKEGNIKDDLLYNFAMYLTYEHSAINYE